MVATVNAFRSNRSFWSPRPLSGPERPPKRNARAPSRGGDGDTTRGVSGDGNRAGRPRVLFANAPRSYRQAMAAAIGTLRPDVEVLTRDPEALDLEVERLRPDVVVCSRVTSLVERRASVWVDLYPDGDRMATVSIAGRRTSTAGLQLEDLLSIVDQGAGAKAIRG